jgi:hypothetical protein
MTFAFAPVVNTTTRPPIDQLAFLGPLTTSESMSCALLGVGGGYWPTAPTGGPPLTWTYQFGCPPKPYS